jgi:hypothetical protein
VSSLMWTWPAHRGCRRLPADDQARQSRQARTELRGHRSPSCPALPMAAVRTVIAKTCWAIRSPRVLHSDQLIERTRPRGGNMPATPRRGSTAAPRHNHADKGRPDPEMPTRRALLTIILVQEKHEDKPIARRRGPGGWPGQLARWFLGMWRHAVRERRAGRRFRAQ